MSAPRRTRRDIESPIQASIFQWLCVAIPREVGFAFAIPNGLHTSKAQAAKAKWMGMRAGMPDLGLNLAKAYGLIVWLEVKTDAKGSGLSDAQDVIHGWLHDLDHRVFVVRSIDDVREILGHLGIPTREAKP